MKNHLPFCRSVYSTLNNAILDVLLRSLILLLLCWKVAPLQAQTLTLARKTGNTFLHSVVASDFKDQSFVLSAFTGTITVGNRTITSLGATDLLLIKYSSWGDVAWVRRIGGPGEERIGDIIMKVYVDKVYLTGSFHSTVRFENADGQMVLPLTSAGQADVFIAMYDNNNGKPGWAQKAGGTGIDYANGMAVDFKENVYLTGSFSDKMKFKMGLTELSLNSSGNSDIFMAKYSSTGVLQFARRLGSTGFDLGKAIAIHDNTQDIYLTGGYSPASHPYTTNIFVARLDHQGNLIWNKIFGSAANVDMGNDITSDLGGINVTGYFGGSITFEGTTLTSKGPADIFVLNISNPAPSQVVSVRQYGGNGWDEGQGITSYGKNLLLSGTFQGTVAFGATNLTAAGGATDKDLFVSQIYFGKDPDWTKRIGSTSMDEGRSIAVADAEHIFFTGSYGASFTIGNTTLNGWGSLLGRITNPVLTQITLYNAEKDVAIQELIGSKDTEINYTLIGTRQLNIRANGISGTIGSIKFILDGVEKIENGPAPFTYPGDAPKSNGGIDYLPFTPSLGKHQLEIIAYAGPNATGIVGTHWKCTLTIVDQAAITGFTLVNALTDQDISLIENQTVIDYAKIGTNLINIRAVVFPSKVGSIKYKLVLGSVAKETLDNTAPYTYAGDTPNPGGGTNYFPVILAPTPDLGTWYYLEATPYTGPNGTGTPGTKYSRIFYVTNSAARLAAAEAEASLQLSSVEVAPNPFNEHTTISFTPDREGQATVEIYTMQGTLVERVYEGSVASGQLYNWPFNARSLPSGAYLVRFKLVEAVLHKRIMLLR